MADIPTGFSSVLVHISANLHVLGTVRLLKHIDANLHVLGFVRLLVHVGDDEIIWGLGGLDIVLLTSTSLTLDSEH